jgi:hypothetical protein
LPATRIDEMAPKSFPKNFAVAEAHRRWRISRFFPATD